MKASSGKRILGIIPARGGSKGIKGKNIVDVCGKPLIAYTLKVANEAVSEGILDRVIVSTDSKEIEDVAKKHDGDVPFLRPETLSGDRSKSHSFVIHALDFLRQKDGEEYDAVMILQPTSPLRSLQDIKASVESFKHSESSSLISCYHETDLLESILYHREQDTAIPLSSNHGAGTGRQLNPKLYVRNGAIYLCDVAYLRKTGSLISEAPLMYEMPKSRSINIDRAEDLEVLRNTIAQQGEIL